MVETGKMTKPEPPLKGRERLKKWLKKDGNTLTGLANRLGVRVPSVHEWTTDGRPGEDKRPLLCAIIGGKPSDWDKNEKERAARKAREKQLRALNGRAA